jgi:hypothetical protein
MWFTKFDEFRESCASIVVASVHKQGGKGHLQPRMGQTIRMAGR